jgi:O6-methylguanine-DNA--protein-cysteine methyltransferase
LLNGLESYWKVAKHTKPDHITVENRPEPLQRKNIAQHSKPEPTNMAVTEFQEVCKSKETTTSTQPLNKQTNRHTNTTLPNEQKVYALLQQIPSGRVSSYAAMASALKSSPRAIGGALRRNPFAPEVVSISGNDKSFASHRSHTSTRSNG